MEQNRHRRKSLLAELILNEIFGSFFVKLCVFLAFGVGMNLVKNEAVCYLVLVVIVLAFCFKATVERRKE